VFIASSGAFGTLGINMFIAGVTISQAITKHNGWYAGWSAFCFILAVVDFILLV
jgi:hypothetical protein